MPGPDAAARVAGNRVDAPAASRAAASDPAQGRRPAAIRGQRVVPMLLTGIAVLAAAIMTWASWQAYMASPWTRDATVRVYVVTIASEVAGRIIQLPVADNQFVHKGDLLMLVDPADYIIAVSSAQAQVEQTKADMENKQVMATRRQELTTLSTSNEERQTYVSSALMAVATYHSALSQLAQSKVNLERTRIVSPVNGWVTNLEAQLGDYTSVGTKNIAVVNADSFWVDGYFEETSLWSIKDGDQARVKLMGSNRTLLGHVQGVSRAINVSNAQSDAAGLAEVSPVFTWVQLAQRVPVRVQLDELPPGVRLVAGQTATVQIDKSR